MPFDPNPLFYKMVRYVSEHKNESDKIIICNEGSSRSSKTWDAIHLIYTYCDHNRNKNKEIYVFRDTLTNCKDYTVKEFEKCLTVITGKPPYIQNPQKPNLKLFGNTIYFRGLIDEEAGEAAPSNVCFFNELLDVDNKSMVAGWLMRCSDIVIGDWNPKFADHWAYDLEKRPNTLFTHSTYKNNKHLEQTIINEIESYNPENPVNVQNGTADDYRWKVYGLGLRASPEGLIFNTEIVEHLPDEYDNEYFGMDFGWTIAPLAIVQVRRVNKELYIKLRTYQPVEDPEAIKETIKEINPDATYWADRADKKNGEDPLGMIAKLRRYGLNVNPAPKFAGSINTGISILKGFKLYIVRDADAIKEANNYKWRTINGKSINEPVDKYNHMWDAVRGVALACLMDG